ncbi:MAG: hypothetical protein M3Y57_07300, partial [Acidobacteriota bacterium]|nr:hypothetical protein [Acidobacteriota bacterium]
RFERRISPQQTNRFCFQSIIGGLCFEPPHRALNSKVVLDKSDSYSELEHGRYIRIAVRTPDENARLIQGLESI